jgi:hypothetical protein
VRTPVLALLAAALVSASLSSPAAAAPAPEGVKCGFSSFTLPDQGGYQYAEIDAGPILLADDTDPSKVWWGSVTCTLQVEPQHGTRSNDLAALTGPVTPGVVSVAGTAAYRYGEGDTVYLCTQVDVLGGPTLYWDDQWDTGSWSTSPTARCASATEVPEPEPTPFQLVDDLIRIVVDPIVCPLLAFAFPPDGDVPVWECPPYDS